MLHSPKKKTINNLSNMKAQGRPAAWITAYDLPFATTAESAGVDMILVGDSGGMVQLGYETTNPVTMNEMITLARAARRGDPKTFMIGDMPQGSYEASGRDAVRNALRFIKEAGSDAVKCEGGRRMAKNIRAMVDAGIPVMGHLGLTPQSTVTLGGYRVQGKTKQTFEAIVEHALELERAGVSAILLEAMPEEPAGQVARSLRIPIYGIGAGSRVDGQLLIVHDLMGFYGSFRPSFAKCYIPSVLGKFAGHIAAAADLKHLGRAERRDGLLALATMAIAEYVSEVRERKFPDQDYTYPLKDHELAMLRTSKYWMEIVPPSALSESLGVDGRGVIE